MSWKRAWQHRWKETVATLSRPTFWWTLLGILGVLLVWVYLFYLAIKHLDTSLSLHSTFCSNDEERNRHILVIVLMTPLFLVGVIGVIGEWMTAMDNRRAGRRNHYKALAGFSVLLQVTALVILFALRC